MQRSSDNPGAPSFWPQPSHKRLFHTVAFASAFLLSSRLPAAEAENAAAHAAVERSGDLAVTSGMTLHLNADLGNVRIQTLPAGAPPVLHYTVHIETDAPEPEGSKLLAAYALITRETLDTVSLSGTLPNSRAMTFNRRLPAIRNAQFWVQFTVTVPATFNLDVSTGAGDIETADLGGRVLLSTQGGNITAGRIGLPGHPIPRSDRPAAKIETDGGHITLKDVDGDVDAFTAGGHIIAGNIDGNAKLRTGGGHIRAARIKGTAQLETEGGNITVGEAGSYVGAHTGGGQIDFGEARGSVRAQTGGGGIRVMYVAGPMEVVTSGGSICLTRVANTVHAQTSEGTITAWITPESRPHQPLRLPGPSQLASHTGDIVVFVPRDISMTIDATVDSGGPSRIEADPSLPLNIQTRPDGPVHAMASLNGGGAPLKLHTAAGKIQLQYLDEQVSLRQTLLNEEKQRLADKLNEYTVTPVSMSSTPPPSNSPPPSLQPNDSKEDWFDAAKARFQVMFMGSLREDEKEFKRHLIKNPVPEYPALARKAGIQGLVILQVRMKTDGSLVVERVLEGPPTLADAASAAVRSWRATPEQVAGRNVEVVSTVSFNFTLH
ncbi:MAG TPA: energy transducer TonB [Candidatus Acidoferrum sp.]|nr:energy transducer TonB [Candidatus Acidoferrum sp.]